MDSIPIVVPSRGRVTTMTTHKCVENCIIVVNDEEVGEYREHHPDLEFVVMPAKDETCVSDKRQFCLEYFDTFFMLDDDVEKVVSLTNAAGEKPNTFSPKEAWNLIQEHYLATKDIDGSLFAFNYDFNPLHFNPMHPFKFGGYVMQAYGVIEAKNHNLWYKKGMNNCDDWWISCLNAYHNRFVFKDLRVFFQADAGTNEGGLTDARGGRSDEAYLHARNQIIKYFGKDLLHQRGKERSKKYIANETLRIPL